MRAFIPDYWIKTPDSLSELLDLLADRSSNWKPLAGGTDLMVLLESGKLAHENYVNIWNLEELRSMETTTQHVTLGALTTYTDIQANQVLRNEFPMLCQAASETGGLAIQNRGTIGGNIVNASPAADSPPALLAYDAEIELISLQGSRWLPYREFHSDYKQMDLRAGELLRGVRLQRATAHLTHYYRKVGTRKAQAISKVCFAGVGNVSEGKFANVRIALGSVAPIPLRCTKTEGVINGLPADTAALAHAREQLAREITPIADIRSTADYRLRVALNLLQDFLVKTQSAAQT